MSEDNDQLKNDKRLNTLKMIVSHSCLLITILSAQYIILGFFSLVFGYYHKGHLLAFALISTMQLVCAPLGYYGIETGNRLYLMIIALVNVVWIISTLLMLIIYWVVLDDHYFDNESALHVGAIVFLGASGVLAVVSFMLMRRLDMISVSLAKPNIKLSPEGKASKK